MPYYYKPKKKAKKKDELPLFEAAGIKVKKKPDLVKKLDRIFSEYIRLRDSLLYKGKYFRCISCGQIKAYEQADCGHYFSRTHMGTRFDEDNCNAECKYCNRFKADHMEGYRINLVKKIGQQRFDLLSVKAHGTYKFSDFELEALIKEYKGKVKALKEKLNDER